MSLILILAYFRWAFYTLLLFAWEDLNKNNQKPQVYSFLGIYGEVNKIACELKAK